MQTSSFLKQIDFNIHILIFFKLFAVQSHIDVDSQSEAGSERGSVNASPFMTAPGSGSIGQGGGGQLSGGTGSLVSGHNGHHYVQPQSLPYHMHHSLIQHLSDLRDLHGGHLPSAAAAAASNQVQGLPLNGVINHHNSNHWMSHNGLKLFWRSGHRFSFSVLNFRSCPVGFRIILHFEGIFRENTGAWE